MKSQESSTWGGKRQGAGRKKEDNPKKTAVIRIDESLLPAIKVIKDRHKAGQDVENLLHVTKNQDDLDIQIEKHLKRNLELVLQRDKEHLQAIKLKSEVESLKSHITRYKADMEALKHKIYDCQALKKDGSRCTRPAKVKINWHGVEINTCAQHSKLSR